MKRTSIVWTIIAIVALLVLLGLVYSFSSRYPVPSWGQVPVSTSTPSSGGAPQATSSSMVTVTQADRGKVVKVKQGSRFLLQLGDLQWNLSISDPSIISRVPNIAVIRGAQGIYNAVKAGTTTLSATGRPFCDAGRICAQYIVDFSTVIQVVP